MSWHLALHADLILKDKPSVAWRSSSLGSSSLDGITLEEWSDVRTQRVDEYLASAAAWSMSAGHEFLAWTVRAGRVELRGLLAEGSLPTWMGSTVAVLAEAGRAGGVGKGLFFGMANPIAYELTVARKVKWTALTGPKIALAGEQRIVREIADLSTSRSGAPRTALDAATEPELALEVWRKLAGDPARLDRFVSELQRLRR